MSVDLLVFPDPNLVLVRRFAPQVIEMVDGAGPYAVCGQGSFVAGDVIHFVGTMADIAGVIPSIFFHTDGATGVDTTAVANPITSDGAFSFDLTLTEAATKVIIGGITHTTGKFTALHVSVN